MLQIDLIARLKSSQEKNPLCGMLTFQASILNVLKQSVFPEHLTSHDHDRHMLASI